MYKQIQPSFYANSFFNQNARTRSISSLKYPSKIGLHTVNDSKLLSTFFAQCISLRDYIVSFTFLRLKLHSFDTTFEFSQSCFPNFPTLATFPSFFPILSFAAAKTFRSLVLFRPPHLTLMFLFSCLQFPARFSNVYSLLTLALTASFCFSTSVCWDVVFNFFL